MSRREEGPKKQNHGAHQNDTEANLEELPETKMVQFE